VGRDGHWSRPNCERLALKTGSEILAETKSFYERFAEALKIVGAGNGTGAIALGAALHSFADKAHVLSWIKSAATIFGLGVLFFAAAYTCFVYAYVHLENYATELDRAAATKADDVSPKAKEASVESMRWAILLTLCSTACFFVGLGTALVALVRF
jgi:hypothetical protein